MEEVQENKVAKLQVGDLVCIYWHDASIGSSLTTDGIPILARSWGLHLGCVGDPKHIVLCQNDFKYNPALHDVDYTAIPAPWIKNIQVLKKAFVTGEEADSLLKSILVGTGTRRRRRGIFQMRTNNHERPD